MRFRRSFSILISLLSLARAFAVPGEPVVTGDPVEVRESSLPFAGLPISRLSFASPVALEALADQAANLTVSGSGVTSFSNIFSLRGQSNTPIFGDPAFTVYIDDIPLGGAFTTPALLSGFSSAEVLRGPGMGTLFGRSGPAGIVRLLPLERTEERGEVRVGYGNHAARNLSGFLAARSDDGGEAMLSFTASSREGTLLNQTTGHRLDDREVLSGLLRLRLRPVENFELKLLVNLLRSRDGEQPLIPLGGSLEQVSRQNEGRTELDSLNAGVTATFKTPWGKLRSTTSLNDWDLGPYLSVASFGPMELLSDAQLAQRNINEEIRLVGDDRGGLPWTAGAFFLDGSTAGCFTRSFEPMKMTIEKSAYDIDARQLAAYGQVKIDLGSGSELVAGLRVETVRKEMERREQIPAPAAYSLRSESGALLPKLMFARDLGSGLRCFVSAGAGYKAGGFSGFTGNRALSAFGPERSRALEAGLSHLSASRAFSGTLRTFWNEISGYQIERSFATGSQADDYLVVNAPKARAFGAEMEFSWKPVEGLGIDASLGLTQATLRSFRDPYTGASYAGRRAPYVPTVDGSLRIDYRHASGFFLGLSLSTTGRIYYTEGEDGAFAQRSRSLLGAWLGYARGAWMLRLGGENLADRKYYSSITPGIGHASPGAPRTWSLETSMKW